MRHLNDPERLFLLRVAVCAAAVVLSVVVLPAFAAESTSAQIKQLCKLEENKAKAPCVKRAEARAKAAETRERKLAAELRELTK